MLVDAEFGLDWEGEIQWSIVGHERYPEEKNPAE